jgi:hypothetical protein
MGWKSIKEHYRIGHQVRVSDGRIMIGSAYVPDLIRVEMDGRFSWGNLGESDNDDLARYFREMKEDPAKLKELIDAPDCFEKSLPVFTYKGSEIIEKQCEEYGWPHVTHDGCMQYENLFHRDKMKVVGWAKESARSGIKYGKRNLDEAERRLAEVRQWLAEDEANLSELEKNYPEVP